ncbi:MAG: DUF58 domain-containing protein, partial [Verrucomicrobia bacterium]|nr:DUF58 domain-containing protein [Verrucomicrobiota bacterium]
EVEKFIPPRKGRRHVLRVIREILAFEPRQRGTNLVAALEFLMHVTSHRAVAVVLSDFLGHVSTEASTAPVQSLLLRSQPALRQANRKHDVVAVQITDRFETELPDVGLLSLQDAETGEAAEINTRDPRTREEFQSRQARTQESILGVFRSLGIDIIRLRTDQPYGAELGRFFEKRERRRLRG